MQRPDVLYVIEHVARELDIACAIRHLAARRGGLQVHVASLLDASAWPARAPRLLAVPYFYSRQDAGVSRLLDRYPGIPVVNLAFEQLFSTGNRQFKRPRDPAARRHVLHLAAGEFFRDFLQQWGVRADNIRLTGSLSCQLYRPPYRAYFADQRQALADRHGLDPDRPWVFFPENFGAAFFTATAIRARIRQGARPEDVYAYRDFARASFREIMPWCRLAARQRRIELIVRPRPAVARQVFIHAYREVTGGGSERHLHFIKDATVRQWILASDVVVSSYSSSLVEAAVACKPVYLLVPTPHGESVRTQWCDAAPQIHTLERFLDILQDIPPDPVASRLTRWAETTLLGHGDAIGNTNEVLALCAEHPVRLPAPPPPRPLWRRWTSAARRLGRTVERHVRRNARRSRPVRAQSHENDSFTSEDVRHRTGHWAARLENTPIDEAPRPGPDIADAA